jgi:hypothetical protein
VEAEAEGGAVVWMMEATPSLCSMFAGARCDAESIGRTTMVSAISSSSWLIGKALLGMEKARMETARIEARIET